MKNYFKAIDEEVDKRIDNNLTFIGIISVLMVSQILNIPFVYGIILVMLLLLVRIGWDLIHSKSREQKRYRQTLSIASFFIFLTAIIWIILSLLLPYLFGILF
ncbi:hypothetical protein CEH05_07495 [Halobacillus halophilus]|nr:hypothetical protein CEH05_07495 [Halobacillus halophilus]